MRPKEVWIFSIVFGLVVLSFISASSYVRYRNRAIDQAALDISENAAPSILYLSKARSEVQNLRRLVRKALDQADTGNFTSPEPIEASRTRIHQQVSLYQSLPMFPNEKLLWEDANRELIHLDDALAKLVTLLGARQLAEAKKVANNELADAARLTGDALLATIEFNAEQAHDQAQQIRRTRIAVNHSSWVLNVLCVLWTVVALVGLGYGYQRQTQLREEARQLAIERAAELEQFAGRMAHDILNPLSVVTYALAGLELAQTEQQQQALFARGRANVKRVVQILDGLLKFACAGARPEPDARTELAEVMTELIAELNEQATAASIELRVEPLPPCSVACSPGILISLVGNLVHNAIKYIRDGAQRWIAVRVLLRKNLVRIEVEDNGPGLPPALEQTIFNPFVRAKTDLTPGFGLGLATVKKAAEAHGGKVGVRSVPGKGCLFWFELPTRESGAEP